MELDGRTRHYAEFYGHGELDRVREDRPLWLVHGNCQAEALRVLLVTAVDAGYRTVRVLLSQPVRGDYRGLPLGTAQLVERLPAGARVLRRPGTPSGWRCSDSPCTGSRVQMAGQRQDERPWGVREARSQPARSSDRTAEQPPGPRTERLLLRLTRRPPLGEWPLVAARVRPGG